MASYIILWSCSANIAQEIVRVSSFRCLCLSGRHGTLVLYDFPSLSVSLSRSDQSFAAHSLHFTPTLETRLAAAATSLTRSAAAFCLPSVFPLFAPSATDHFYWRRRDFHFRGVVIFHCTFTYVQSIRVSPTVECKYQR